jgi:hypothetical protein
MTLRPLLVALAALLGASPALALAPGDLLLVKDSTLFHYEKATGALRVLSSPDVGTGPVWSGGRDVAVLRFGAIAVAADALYLVDPATGDRTQLTEPLGAFAVDSLRDGRIFALGTNSSLYEVDPGSGQAEQVANYYLDFPAALSATPGQRILVPVGDALLEYDPATHHTRTVSAARFSTKGEQGSGPPLQVVDAVAPPGDVAYGVINASMTRIQLDSGDRESVAAYLGAGSGVIWWSETQGVDLDPQRRPLVVARRPNGALSWFTLDPVTLVRSVVDFPTVTVEGVAFAGSDGFAAVPADDDGDGTGDDVLDICPGVFDPGQEDTDGDLVGDACNDSADSDGDEWADALDNCPETANADQADTDANGTGDACNDAADSDGDEWADALDNCPHFPNDQADLDGDGLGDVCDPFPAEPDNEKGQLRVDLAQCLARPVFTDADGDGEADPGDACPDTAAGAAVDSAGCSLAQFCAALDAAPPWTRLLTCGRLDWRNDEPERVLPGDCAVVWRGPLDFVCAAR